MHLAFKVKELFQSEIQTSGFIVIIGSFTSSYSLSFHPASLENYKAKLHSEVSYYGSH